MTLGSKKMIASEGTYLFDSILAFKSIVNINIQPLVYYQFSCASYNS